MQVHERTSGVGVNFPKFAQLVFSNDSHLFPIRCILTLLQLHVDLNVLQ